LIRDQLLQLSPNLFALLDPQWTAYLALPLADDKSANELSAVRRSLANYDSVAQNPQYADLASRPEFRSVHSLLKHYEHALSPQMNELHLPPPPGN
jgi:hypothetical protein